MYEDSVGCMVNRYTVEKRMGRTLSDDEWMQVLAEVDCDSVEDAIIGLAKTVIEGGKNA